MHPAARHEVQSHELANPIKILSLLEIGGGFSTHSYFPVIQFKEIR
jgi:hypothetical protein